MNISAWSIRNPIAPILAFVVLVVLGWQSFATLPITQSPNIDVPVVSIVVTQSGATPAELEAQVAKPIEDEVAGISGVHHVESTITDGTATMTVTFRLEVPTAQAVQDVKDAVDRIRGDLHAAIDAPIVSRVQEGSMTSRFNWIQSDGGPLICVPTTVARLWRGTDGLSSDGTRR